MDQLGADEADIVLMISRRHLGPRLPPPSRELLMNKVRELGSKILTLEELRSPGPLRRVASEPYFRTLDPAQRGRRRKHEKGGYAFGAPPYGWRAADRQLVLHQAEQKALARAHPLRVSGMSLRKLCALLNAEKHMPRRAPAWNPRTLSRVLDRLCIPTHPTAKPSEAPASVTKLANPLRLGTHWLSCPACQHACGNWTLISLTGPETALLLCACGQYSTHPALTQEAADRLRQGPLGKR
jgi:hypothetical protein